MIHLKHGFFFKGAYNLLWTVGRLKVIIVLILYQLSIGYIMDDISTDTLGPEK